MLFPTTQPLRLTAELTARLAALRAALQEQGFGRATTDGFVSCYPGREFQYQIFPWAAEPAQGAHPAPAAGGFREFRENDLPAEIGDDTLAGDIFRDIMAEHLAEFGHQRPVVAYFELGFDIATGALAINRDEETWRVATRESFCGQPGTLDQDLEAPMARLRELGAAQVEMTAYAKDGEWQMQNINCDAVARVHADEVAVLAELVAQKITAALYFDDAWWTSPQAGLVHMCCDAASGHVSIDTTRYESTHVPQALYAATLPALAPAPEPESASDTGPAGI